LPSQGHWVALPI